MASKAVIIKVVKPASGSSQAEVRRFSRSSEAAAFTPVSFQEFVSAIRKQFAVPADVQVSLHYDDDETSAVEIVSNAEQLQEGFRKANLSGKGLRLNLSVGSAPVASAPSNPQLGQAKAATASSTTAASSPAAPAAAVASVANEVSVREAKQPLPPAVEYHVRNVPHDFPLAELSHLFAAFGTVEDVSLSPDAEEPGTLAGTLRLRTDQADHAPHYLNGVLVNGVPLHVVIAGDTPSPDNFVHVPVPAAVEQADTGAEPAPKTTAQEPAALATAPASSSLPLSTSRDKQGDQNASMNQAEAHSSRVNNSEVKQFEVKQSEVKQSEVSSSEMKQSAPGPATVLFQGYPPDVSADVIRNDFSFFGRLLQCSLTLDQTGRPVGSGSVQFESTEAVDRVLQARPIQYGHHEITVEVVTDNAKSASDKGASVIVAAPFPAVSELGPRQHSDTSHNSDSSAVDTGSDADTDVTGMADVLSATTIEEEDAKLPGRTTPRRGSDELAPASMSSSIDSMSSLISLEHAVTSYVAMPGSMVMVSAADAVEPALEEAPLASPAAAAVAPSEPAQPATVVSTVPVVLSPQAVVDDDRSSDSTARSVFSDRRSVSTYQHVQPSPDSSEILDAPLNEMVSTPQASRLLSVKRSVAAPAMEMPAPAAAAAAIAATVDDREKQEQQQQEQQQEQQQQEQQQEQQQPSDMAASTPVPATVAAEAVLYPVSRSLLSLPQDIPEAVEPQPAVSQAVPVIQEQQTVLAEVKAPVVDAQPAQSAPAASTKTVERAASDLPASQPPQEVVLPVASEMLPHGQAKPAEAAAPAEVAPAPAVARVNSKSEPAVNEPPARLNALLIPAAAAAAAMQHVPATATAAPVVDTAPRCAPAAVTPAVERKDTVSSRKRKEENDSDSDTSSTCDEALHDVVCNGCGAKPITGSRHVCMRCADVDLCGKCQATLVSSAAGVAVAAASTGTSAAAAGTMTPAAAKVPQGALFNLTLMLTGKHEHTAAHPMMIVEDPLDLVDIPVGAKVDPRTGKIVHWRIACDDCGAAPLLGDRYTCSVCSDFDLCELCFADRRHVRSHPMLRLPEPVTEEQLGRLLKRAHATRRAAMLDADQLRLATDASMRRGPLPPAGPPPEERVTKRLVTKVLRLIGLDKMIEETTGVVKGRNSAVAAADFEEKYGEPVVVPPVAPRRVVPAHAPVANRPAVPAAVPVRVAANPSQAVHPAPSAAGRPAVIFPSGMDAADRYPAVVPSPAEQAYEPVPSRNAQYAPPAAVPAHVQPHAHHAYDARRPPAHAPAHAAGGGSVVLPAAAVAHPRSVMAVNPVDAELYGTQLAELYVMGFEDAPRNAQMLKAANGNLASVLDQLLAQAQGR